ncbi:hypothetical protein [Bacillus sp. RHFS10]|uniref:hypothetical protein n=1 Tax=Bacillus sp. RHFS10 TaxID=2804501 RepID=UPI0019261FE1|nr:hypothetical protein [Bacillus sp. RHFS10]MBL3648417.1 hypothetical protein [Bacillus sp. RHFS10]
MNETVPCIQCGKTTDACCDGYECGCKGLPIHPPLCEECEKDFFKEGAETIKGVTDYLDEFKDEWDQGEKETEEKA